MQIPVDCLGMCMSLIFLKVLDHVLKLKHVLLHDWATMHACVVDWAALKSVGVTKMLKYNCSDTRLNQDIEATLNSSWCVISIKIFLAG